MATRDRRAWPKPPPRSTPVAPIAPIADDEPSWNQDELSPLVYEEEFAPVEPASRVQQDQQPQRQLTRRLPPRQSSSSGLLLGVIVGVGLATFVYFMMRK